MLRLNCVRTSTSLGRTADLAGTRTTSSYVNPRRGSCSSITLPSIVSGCCLRGSLCFLDFRCCFRLFLKPLAAFFGRHELLHSCIAAVDDEHASLGIHSDAVREIKLAVSVAVAAPLRDEVPFLVKLFDPVVSGIRYIDVTGPVARDAPRRPQLSRFLR